MDTSTTTKTSPNERYRAQVPVLILQGSSPDAIAQMVGVSPRIVRAWLMSATGMSAAQWRSSNGWVGSVSPAIADDISRAWCADRLAGFSTIARKVGVNPSQVAAVVKQRGLCEHEDVQGPQGPSAQTVLDIITAYNHGTTTVELGERYGLHEKTIRRRLDAAGVQRRTRGGQVQLNNELRERVLAEYKVHPSIAHVVSKTPLGKSRVRALLVEAGIDIKPGGAYRRTPGTPRKTTKQPDSPASSKASSKASGKSRDRAQAVAGSEAVTAESSEVVEMVLAAWKRHPSLSRVAQDVGMGRRRVRRILETARIEVPTRPSPKQRKSDDEVREPMLQAWRETGSFKQIERVTGIGKTRALRMLREQGLVN